MQPKHRRILIVGSGGAGKSTLSRQLAEQWDVPVVHLDALFWKPGWNPTPRPEFMEKVKVELTKPEWIIDGNYDSSIELRAQYADLIIFLDFSNVLCLYRACKRAWKYRGVTRPDMGEGCPEKIDWEFVRWIWRYPKDARPGMLKILSKVPADVITLKSPKEVKTWLQHGPNRKSEFIS
ncbi:DNA topology modulation protein [Paenisporosarcina indica]|uniref:DNA topology modulation protein n=1 Tax=Paenisporosarcina indica TaxID=650093 RepID=UPI00094FDDDF|nr:DNA topology modulation protein [Paenisporosarcina indica]